VPSGEGTDVHARRYPDPEREVLTYCALLYCPSAVCGACSGARHSPLGGSRLSPPAGRQAGRSSGYRDAPHRLIPLDEPMANDEHVALLSADGPPICRHCVPRPAAVRRQRRRGWEARAQGRKARRQAQFVAPGGTCRFPPNFVVAIIRGIARWWEAAPRPCQHRGLPSNTDSHGRCGANLVAIGGGADSPRTWYANDPEPTPSVHRSTTESAVPKGPTVESELFGDPMRLFV
jgi:hypothetical protein